MRLRIQHTTRYEYAEPVGLGVHVLRLQPRTDAMQRVEAHTLNVTPEPSSRSNQIGFDGACETVVHFGAPTASLNIVAESDVETLRSNPFDFLQDTRMGALPWAWGPEERRRFGPALDESDAIPAATRGHYLALAQESPVDAVAFTSRLNIDIHGAINRVYREFGPPLPAAETLSKGEGSCRDLAALFIAGCRSVGIPARFVSGYHLDDQARDEWHLHGWAEAFLPGGGWRAFDPTLGVANTTRHIALYAAPAPADAAPVTGAYFGDASATLQSGIQIQILDATDH